MHKPDFSFAFMHNGIAVADFSKNFLWMLSKVGICIEKNNRTI